MKKRNLYLIGAGVIVILIIAYSGSDFSYMNIIPRTALPEKYKSYREIEDGIVSKYYQSELLFKSDNETSNVAPPLFNATDNTVVVVKQTDTKKDNGSDFFQTYLKLDADGTVIDSLIYKYNWPSELAGYLITPHGYCSWVLNGDKRIHPYIEENKSLTEDSASLTQHFKKLYQNSSFVYCYDQFDLDDRQLQDLQFDKAIFYQHGKWIALFGKNLSDFYLKEHNRQSSPFKLQSQVKGQSQVNSMVNRVDKQHPDKRNAIIYMDHFQKEHYEKGQGPGFYSPNGMSTADQWEGSGYFNIILKKDTLHLKQAMSKDDDDLTQSDMSPYSWGFIGYFTCVQLNFGLFANDNHQLFIIKKKAK